MNVRTFFAKKKKNCELGHELGRGRELGTRR
jgi:hypothetical protein